MAGIRMIDWAAVRVAYEETDETIASIVARFGTHPANLHKRREAEGWTPRSARLARRQVEAAAARRPPPDLANLVTSLQRTTARVVALMEEKLAAGGDGVAEGEVKALGALATTLAKVISLKPPERPSRDQAPSADAAEPAAAGSADDDAMLDDLVRSAERFLAARRAEVLSGEPAAGDAELAAAPLAAEGAPGPVAAGG